MKLPRNVSPIRVIILLRSRGYQLAPQKGNHIRLRHPGKPVDVVTFLNQDPREPRTLRWIIAAVSSHAFVPPHALVAQL